MATIFSPPSRRSSGPPAAFVPRASFGDPLDIHLRTTDHSYWHHDERIIGATETLLELDLFDPSYYTAEGRDRGGRVHDRTAALDRGHEAPPVLATDLGYVESWTRYCRLWQPQMILVERSLWDPVRRVAGTPDRVAVLRRPGFRPALAVLDPKTGAEETWHRYQLAIYGVIVTAWRARCAPSRGLAALPLVLQDVYLREDGGDPKVRVWPVDPVVHALIAAAQLKRVLAPRVRS